MTWCIPELSENLMESDFLIGISYPILHDSCSSVVRGPSGSGSIPGYHKSAISRGNP